MLISPICTRREALELTRAELGVLTGVSGSAIGLFERGEALPSGNTLSRLASALRRDSGELAVELGEFQDAVRAQLRSRVTNLSAVVGG